MHQEARASSVGVAEHSAVDDKFDNHCRYDVTDSNNESCYEIDAHDKIQRQRKRKQNVRHHIENSGVFAVFGDFALGEWILGSKSPIKSIRQLASDKNHKCPTGFAADASPNEKQNRQ